MKRRRREVRREDRGGEEGEGYSTEGIIEKNNVAISIESPMGRKKSQMKEN